MKKLFTMLTVSLGLFACSKSNAETAVIESNKNLTNKNKKILVVYFSETGNTKRIAEIVAKDLNVDIFEIVPKVSYTKDDLNYGDKDSRATREQYDENSRPVIKNKINDISKYDTIIIGHPIWWGEAPKIIRTFLESENFNGKIISTFVTSGSSDIGSSAEPLKSIVKGATWKDGRRFDNSNSEKEIKDWIRSLGL